MAQAPQKKAFEEKLGEGTAFDLDYGKLLIIASSFSLGFIHLYKATLAEYTACRRQPITSNSENVWLNSRFKEGGGVFYREPKALASKNSGIIPKYSYFSCQGLLPNFPRLPRALWASHSDAIGQKWEVQRQAWSERTTSLHW